MNESHTVSTRIFLLAILLCVINPNPCPAQTPAVPLSEPMTLKGQLCKTERRLENDGVRIQYCLKMNNGRVQLPDMPRTDGTSVVINLDEFVDECVELQAIGYSKMVDEQAWLTIESIQAVQRITDDEAWNFTTLTLSGLLRRHERVIEVDESNQTTRVCYFLETNDGPIPLPPDTSSPSEWNVLIDQSVQARVKASAAPQGTNHTGWLVQKVIHIQATVESPDAPHE